MRRPSPFQRRLAAAAVQPRLSLTVAAQRRERLRRYAGLKDGLPIPVEWGSYRFSNIRWLTAEDIRMAEGLDPLTGEELSQVQRGDGQ